jgi:hypothetical protein
VQIDPLVLLAALLLLLALDVALRTYRAVRGMSRLASDLQVRADALDQRAERIPAAALELRDSLSAVRSAGRAAFVSLSRFDGQLLTASRRLSELCARSDSARGSLMGAHELMGPLRTSWQLVRTALAVRRVVG